MARPIKAIVAAFFLFHVIYIKCTHIDDNLVISNQNIWDENKDLIETQKPQVSSIRGKLLNISKSKSQVILKIITTLVVLSAIGFLVNRCIISLKKGFFSRNRRLGNTPQCTGSVEYQRVDIDPEERRIIYARPVTPPARALERYKKLKMALIVLTFLFFIYLGWLTAKHLDLNFRSVEATLRVGVKFCDQVLEILDHGYHPAHVTPTQAAYTSVTPPNAEPMNTTASSVNSTAGTFANNTASVNSTSAPIPSVMSLSGTPQSVMSPSGTAQSVMSHSGTAQSVKSSAGITQTSVTSPYDANATSVTSMLRSIANNGTVENNDIFLED